jgi:phosphate-selective porin
MKIPSRFSILTLLVALAFPAVMSAQDAQAVTSSKAFSLSGYTQVLYAAPQDEAGGFSIRRARLAFSAALLKNVHFKIQADLTKSPALVDTLVEVILHEAVSIRIGQFKVPFSLEMTTSSGDLDLINRSRPIGKMSPSLDIGGSGRDIGAVVFGKAAILEYTLGLFNGSGANKADTNDRKDLAGRLVVHPLSFLSVGASFYDGSYAPAAGQPSRVRDRIGADLAVLRGPYSLKADFLQAEDGETMRRGWYVQGGYAFLPKRLQGIVRFDSYDPDGAVSGDRLDTWTVGLNWFLAGRTKLQINYETIRGQSAGNAGRTLLIQFQAGY